MLAEEFLIEHQKIVKQLLEDKPNLSRMERLLDQLNTTVAAYCECADDHRYAMDKWNKRAKGLCELRDLIAKAIGKHSAKGEKEDVSS